MNKTDLIDVVAESADLPKASAGRAVDAMVNAITKALKKNDEVTLVGFGTFSVRKRAARAGRCARARAGSYPRATDEACRGVGRQKPIPAQGEPRVQGQRPHLEHQQRPDQLALIGHAAFVLLQQTLDISGIE